MGRIRYQIVLFQPPFGLAYAAGQAAALNRHTIENHERKRGLQKSGFNRPQTTDHEPHTEDHEHKIDQKLKEHLNITPTSQFQLSAINDDVATIVVDSSSWATRLRYNIPKILTILNKKLGYPSIKTIRIKIKKKYFW